jgi:hypothetical protein
MALSALTDKSSEPTEHNLREVLGKAFDIWELLISSVDERIGPTSRIWARTSKSTGWGLRLRQKDRIILYMTPQSGRFLVSFALGEKAVAAARRLKLPAQLLSAIDAAPRYAEGRGLRVEVSRRGQVRALAMLAQVKHEN